MLVSPIMKCGDPNGHATVQSDSLCVAQDGTFSPPKFSGYATPSNAQFSPEKPAVLVFSPTSDTDIVAFISNSENGCLCPEKITDAQVITDCDHLTATELREKYHREANSHKNMLSRQKTNGAVIHPDFRVFRSFIRIVGPIPAKGGTLDRIDNTDPEYAPGKVRWADKHTQNNNKGDNLIFHDPVTGQYHTAAQLAAKQGVTHDTIRKRRKREWTDQEIIAGKKSIAQPPMKLLPPKSHAQIFGPRENEPRWTSELAKATQAGNILRVLELTAWKQEHGRRAEFHRRHREQHPDDFEALLSDHMTMNRVQYGSDCELPITRARWLELFREDWPKDRPHVIFERCSPHHKQAIKEIDPDYVQRHREALAQQAELKAML